MRSARRCSGRPRRSRLRLHAPRCGRGGGAARSRPRWRSTLSQRLLVSQRRAPHDARAARRWCRCCASDGFPARLNGGSERRGRRSCRPRFLCSFHLSPRSALSSLEISRAEVDHLGATHGRGNDDGARSLRRSRDYWRCQRHRKRGRLARTGARLARDATLGSQQLSAFSRPCCTGRAPATPTLDDRCGRTGVLIHLHLCVSPKHSSSHASQKAKDAQVQGHHVKEQTDDDTHIKECFTP